MEATPTDQSEADMVAVASLALVEWLHRCKPHQ